MEEELKAISAIDGRYKYKTKELIDFFSEYALFKYRIQVEIEYFIFLSQLKLTHLKDFNADNCSRLRNIYLNFYHKILFQRILLFHHSHILS